MKRPERMKAWVLVEPERLELLEVDVPVLRADQVLVKIDRACICNGSDPGIYHGHEAYPTPLIFGHEASGRIVEAGGAVRGFAAGDRVCWWFEAGAFAEYQTVTPGNVAMFCVPEEITRDQAPVMELVLASCRALMDRPPKEGRSGWRTAQPAVCLWRIARFFLKALSEMADLVKSHSRGDIADRLVCFRQKLRGF